MENASKALMMAAGILIGILILSLMVTLFINSKKLSTGYEQTKQSEAIQQFNVNFTKYLGRDLSIHEAITITNFANENKVKNNTQKKIADIESNIEKKYILNVSYDESSGYINEIEITNKN